jgi:hypothetical protein
MKELNLLLKLRKPIFKSKHNRDVTYSLSPPLNWKTTSAYEKQNMQYRDTKFINVYTKIIQLKGSHLTNFFSIVQKFTIQKKNNLPFHELRITMSDTKKMRLIKCIIVGEMHESSRELEKYCTPSLRESCYKICSYGIVMQSI